VVDVPLFDAGQAVGMCAGQDNVGFSLETDAALVQRVRIDIARQLEEKRNKVLVCSTIFQLFW
jgi:hypothetical protein